MRGYTFKIDKRTKAFDPDFNSYKCKKLRRMSRKTIARKLERWGI